MLIDDPRSQCIMFRRTSPQLIGQGGLWDTATEIYNQLPDDIKPRRKEKDLEFIFPNLQDPKDPNGARVKYRHLQHEKDKLDHQGLNCSPLTQ